MTIALFIRLSQWKSDMTNLQILEKFLISRGFSNVRTSGRVLDAAAIYHNKTFAFKICTCRKRVNGLSGKSFLVSYPNNIKECYGFSRDIGYDCFILVCFFENKKFCLTEHRFQPNTDFSNIVVRPDGIWSYQELLDEVFFTRKYGSEIKIKKKRLVDLLTICDGNRYTTIDGEKTAIECIFRNECKRYIAWKRYDKHKQEGKLHRMYYTRDIKYLKPLVMGFSDWSCPKFKKKTQLQTKIEEKDERRRNYKR